MRKHMTKLFSLLCAIVMVGAMLPTSALAAGTDSGVTLNKSATALDENNQTTVTLQIGATQQSVESNVVFVLDKSTSADVRTEAGNMLDALYKQVAAGNTVNVAVVYFESSASATEWVTLSSETLATIKNNINQKQNESGTNVWYGLKTAKDMLDAKKGDNHLVLVTDGITYLWGEPDENGHPYTIYNEFITNNTDPGYTNQDAWNIWAGGSNVVYYNKYPADFKLTEENGTYVESLKNAKTWLESNGNALASFISEYERLYTDGVLYNSGKVQADNTDNTYGKYVSRVTDAGLYTACDAAIYKTVTMWRSILDAGYHTYAFADTTGDPDTSNTNAYNAKLYPWASAFINGLGTLGGYSTVVGSDGINGMFDGVKDSILYEIQSGTVTDVVGDCFDLVSTDTFKLCIDGTEIDRDETAVSSYNISFASGNYGINYDETRDSFTWAINVPVEAGTALTLSYVLKLNEDAVEDYKTENNISKFTPFDVPTNKSATLEYVTTTGEEKKEDFNQPVITLGDKESEPSLDKTSSGGDSIGNVTPGNNIYFELNSNLPESLASYVRNVGTEDEPNYQITDRQAHLMVFHDTMSDNLIFNQDSLVVKIDSTTLPSSYYRIKTENIGDETFTVTVDLAAAFNAGYITLEQLGKAAPIVVTYRAQLSSSAANGDSISNSACVNDSEVDTITGEVSDPETPPATGGMGTALFTVGGVALLAAAGALYVVSRKKNENA